MDSITNKDAAQEATARTYKRMDRIIVLRQEIQARNIEITRLVRENEDDSWLSHGQRWRGKVVTPDQFRNNMRFRIKHQPTTHCA